MNNSNRTKSLGSEWVKNEIILHTIITSVFETVSHQSLKPKSLLNLARLDSSKSLLNLTRLLKIALFSNYRVLTVHQWSADLLFAEWTRAQLTTFLFKNVRNFRFGYPIYESCHMAKNKGGYIVTDCMNMKLKLGEYILQLHTSQIDTIEPEGK